MTWTRNFVVIPQLIFSWIVQLNLKVNYKFVSSPVYLSHQNNNTVSNSQYYFCSYIFHTIPHFYNSRICFKNRKMRCLIHSFSFPLYQHRAVAAFACWICRRKRIEMYEIVERMDEREWDRIVHKKTIHKMCKKIAKRIIFGMLIFHWIDRKEFIHKTQK